MYRLASSPESVKGRVKRHGYGAGEVTDLILCTRPTTLKLWLIDVLPPPFIKPLQGKRSSRIQSACWQACLVSEPRLPTGNLQHGDHVVVCTLTVE